MSSKPKYQSKLEFTPAEINSMNAESLQGIVKELAGVANRRFDALGTESPAKRGAEITGGRFTSGGTLNELRAEYKRVKNFLESETSTVSGTKNFIRGQIKDLQKEGVEISTEEQYSKFWRTYENLKDIEPSITEKEYKYKVLQELGRLDFDQMDVDELTQQMQDRLDEIYERNEEYYAGEYSEI